MAQEITIELFERNAKVYNKKGLRRSYSSIPDRPAEYIGMKPLGASSKFVLEVVIDKASGLEFQEYLKRKDFMILGAKNYFHIGNMLQDYHEKESLYETIKERMDAVQKDYLLMKENPEPFEELENEDVKFHFLPYNDEIKNLCDFIEEEKNSILQFAKEKDITIILNIIGYCNMVKGFFGFNFLDADAKEETVIDYSSNIVVNVDFSQRVGTYAAALLLKGITDNAEDLELMNCHIVAENLKYDKE